MTKEEQYKKILLTLGFNAASAVFGENADLDTTAEIEAYNEARKAVVINDVSHEIKSKAEIAARAHIYTEVENHMLASVGKTRQELSRDDLPVDAKWKDVVNYALKTKAKSAPPSEASKEAVEKLQADLVRANALLQEKEALVADIPNQVNAFKTEMLRDGKLIKSIASYSKGLLNSNPEHNYLILKDKAFSEADILPNESGEFIPYKKGIPGQRLMKPGSETLFANLEDYMHGLIEREKLNVQSNGEAQKVIDMKGTGTQADTKLPFPGFDTLSPDAQKQYTVAQERIAEMDKAV